MKANVAKVRWYIDGQKFTTWCALDRKKAGVHFAGNIHFFAMEKRKRVPWYEDKSFEYKPLSVRQRKYLDKLYA